MTTAQLWAAALTGTLLTTLLAGVKFAFDAVTGRRVRRVSDGKAELELAEMVKRVAASEVATLTVRLERTEAKSNRAHAELAALPALCERHEISLDHANRSLLRMLATSRDYAGELEPN